MKVIFSQTNEQILKLKSLPYFEYLRTPYWKAVSAYMRTKYPRCMCSLHVGKLRAPLSRDPHHCNGYACRGVETEADLVMLAAACHARIHGIKPKSVTRTTLKRKKKVLAHGRIL